MGVVAVTVVALAVLAFASVSPAQPATATCRNQSGAEFPGAFTDPDNVVVGPLAFVGLRGAATTTPNNLKRFGGYKSPLLVRAGRTATISIDPAARSFVRLNHGGFRGPFRRLPHTIRAAACPERQALSDVDGRPVTFWSGFFVVTRPGCVPVTITVRRRAPVTQTIGFARTC